MWEYLNYIIMGSITWFLYDFFAIPKNSPGKNAETNAQKVGRLYQEIESMNVRIHSPVTFLDKVKLKVSTALDTAKTIAEMQTRLAFNRLFSKKVGRHLLAIPYFHHDRWHYALVPSKSWSGSIIKITSNEREVTDEIVKYLGPDENFYGHTLTPSMFNYEELTIYMISSGGFVSKKFLANDTITLHNS